MSSAYSPPPAPRKLGAGGREVRRRLLRYHVVDLVSLAMYDLASLIKNDAHREKLKAGAVEGIAAAIGKMR